jgi:uncharacterized protein Yka (UPF0111/DUF47 family)
MVLARFLPRDEAFFTYFEEAATNAAEVAAVLLEVVGNGPEADRKVRRLRDLEHRGDEITHRIYSALNSTFVTPLDREDIQQLAAAFDNFVDDMEEAGKRRHLYRIDHSTDTARLFARILSEQAACLADAMPHLEHLSKHSAELRRAVVEIHRLENEADDALNQALATLYNGVTDIPGVILAIRWGELYGLLEDATDGAEGVAHVLEGILIKNA